MKWFSSKLPKFHTGVCLPLQMPGPPGPPGDDVDAQPGPPGPKGVAGPSVSLVATILQAHNK